MCACVCSTGEGTAAVSMQMCGIPGRRRLGVYLIIFWHRVAIMYCNC